MELEKLPWRLSVCRAADAADIAPAPDFCFIGKTDEEISLVCKTEDVPAGATARDDGWKAFRVRGILDFSLIGILAKLSGILAENGISIFAVSTFNTDYILVREENFDRAMSALENAGYTVL